MRWRASLSLLGLLAVFPSIASAQLGGIVKKVVEKSTVPPPTDPPTFNDVTLELTPARIDKVIAAFLAVRAMSNGPTGSSALRLKLNTASDKVGEFRSKNERAIAAFEEKQNKIRDCVDSVLAETKTKRQKDFMQNAMADPQKVLELSQALMEAQQKRDTAAIRKLTAQAAGMGEPTKADSQAARKVCGDPTPPPALGQLAALEKAQADAEEALRAAEAAESKAEENQSGMKANQYHIAVERMQMWLEKFEKNAQQKGFTPSELKALEARHKDIKAMK